MSKIFLLLVILLPAHAFGRIHPANFRVCKQELDATPLKNFSTKTIVNHSRELGTTLVQIRNNELFIDEKPVTEAFITNILTSPPTPTIYLDLLLTMYKLVQLRKLPDVTFLYTKHCYDIDKNKLRKLQIPILVGVNSPLYEKSHLITFISSCPLARQYLGEDNKNWSLEYAFSETIASHEKIPWSEKSSKIFWRGFLSDVIGWEKALEKRKCLCDFHLPDLYVTPREYLCLLSQLYPDVIDAGVTSIAYGPKILQMCDVKPNASILEHVQHKYQIVLDGIHCTTPGYAWRLLSDCCVLKVDSILYNFFYVGLIPWVHYVPISEDLHDLLEIHSFLEAHQDMAQKIANNGKEFALKHLKPDDYLDFCVLVLELYARKQQKADQLL